MSNKFTVHRDHDEVSDSDFQLLKEKCLEARDLSYSPYSKFRVGCALITDSGEFVKGANVENASYGAGICAERNAITRALMEGNKKLKVIAISSDSEEPISPCGICRQFIREFAPDIPVFMFSGNGETFYKSYLHELLPLSFGPENLDITSLNAS